MLDVKRVLASAPRAPQDVALRELYTPWGERIAAGEERVAGHPRPQFARESFVSLDGWWECAFVACEDTASAWRRASAPTAEAFDQRIRVPFSPEAPLSGVGRQLQPNELLWYRRMFTAPAGERRAEVSLLSDAGEDAGQLPTAMAGFLSCEARGEQEGCERQGSVSDAAGERVLLHFEAVDWACACYVNGVRVGEHMGGYLPFAFDVTDALAADGGQNELVVCVFDPSDAGVQLRGKQRLARGGIWYTAQSGIWQTVWLEVVPARRIEALEIDAQADEGRVRLNVTVTDAGDTAGTRGAPLPLVARVFDDGEEVARAEVDAVAGTHELTLAVPDPHLWCPDDPHLYDLKLTYGDDRVTSYCAFRTVSVEVDAHGVPRFFLNHKPLFLRGVLDQGYWPDGLMTAPSDEALEFDIRTMKGLGFNLLRKHIKVEGGRFYYLCDKLGMLVWQDMVSGGGPLSSWHSSYKPTFFRSSWGCFADTTPRHRENLSAGSAAFRDEWTATCVGTISLLKNHPCIVGWVLFNEGWGQFDAQAATRLVRELDPSRPIDAVSGWYDQRCGDFLSVHNYFRPLAVYPDAARPKRAFVISEFGGLSFHLPEHSSLTTSYGYGSFDDLEGFRAGVREILTQADALEAEGLAGFVYTQLSDVEEETNGLITYDRRVSKLDEEERA